jgi:hypothetical protein
MLAAFITDVIRELIRLSKMPQSLIALQVIKNAVGRPRPDLIDRCKPVTSL